MIPMHLDLSFFCVVAFTLVLFLTVAFLLVDWFQFKLFANTLITNTHTHALTYLYHAHSHALIYQTHSHTHTLSLALTFSYTLVRSISVFLFLSIYLLKIKIPYWKFYEQNKICTKWNQLLAQHLIRASKFPPALRFLRHRSKFVFPFLCFLNLCSFRRILRDCIFSELVWPILMSDFLAMHYRIFGK